MPKRPSKERAATVAPTASPSGFTDAQVDAAVAARDRAATGNPRVVRRAFLGGQPIRLGDLAIQPLTIGTFWLLEEIKSPLADPAAAAKEVTFPQLAEAALVLTKGREAAALWAEGQKAFRAAAMDLAWTIPIEHLSALGDAMAGRVTEAQDIMPPEPAGEDKSFLEHPAKTPVSAGG